MHDLLDCGTSYGGVQYTIAGLLSRASVGLAISSLLPLVPMLLLRLHVDSMQSGLWHAAVPVDFSQG